MSHEGAAPRPGETTDEDLGRRVRSGLTWSFASNILTRITTLVTGIVMARLLAPEDFGVFAVAMVALTVLVNINDLGLEQSVVRWPTDITRIAPTANTVIFGSSVLLCAGCLLLAGPFAHAFGAPEATGIVQLMCLGLLFNGAFAVPSAVLTREFRQDKRTIADFAGFLVGTAITIALAVMGFGAWALAWGRFVGNGTVSLLHFAFTPHRYGFGWNTPDAKALLRSGLPLGGATLVAVALLNLDYLVIGRLLGTEDLGYYTLAFNLASWPVTFFAVAVARVSVPGFARLQHDPPRLQAAYTRWSTVLLAVTLPVCLLLGAFADPLVRFVYGDKWAPAVTVLRLLAVLGLLRVVYQFWADVLVAVGAGRRTLVSQVVWLSALVPALIVGVEHGLRGVGTAHVAVALGIVGPVLLVCMRGVISVTENLRDVLHLLLATVMAAGAAVGVQALGLHEFWTLALGSPLTLAVFTAVAWPVAVRLGLRPAAALAALTRVVRRRRPAPVGGAPVSPPTAGR